MLRFFRSSFGLWAVWAVLLLAFVFVSPRPSAVTFWVLLLAAFGVGALGSRRQHIEATQEQDAYVAWSSRLMTSGAIVDVEDDGHLYEWLDPPHWQVVFDALEQLPPSGRSLRQVLLAKFPDVLP